MIESRDGTLAFEGRKKYALGTRRGDEMCEFLLMTLVSSKVSEVFAGRWKGFGMALAGAGSCTGNSIRE